MIIERFEPVALHIERVGPFEQEYVLDFMKTYDNEADRPARFFLLASQNARGKTTLLEAFALAINILGGECESCSLPIIEDLGRRNGLIQLNVRVTAITKQELRTDIVLSLSVGGKMYEYLPAELERLNAPDGQEYIVATSTLEIIRTKGRFANELVDSIARVGNQTFRGFFNEELTFPTTIFFTSERGISRPLDEDIVIAKPGNLNYKPCHVIGREESGWRNSTDNLFCWFAWLSQDEQMPRHSLFEKACDLVNQSVFTEPDKRLQRLSRDPPYPMVKSEGQFHRLDRLSSGERARLQLILRTASLMTAHTVLLIDELELHLHPVWQHRLVESLIELVRRHPGLYIYYTTHSKELVERGIKHSFDKDEVLVASHKIIG
jgi:hypothetical protein